MKKYAIGVDIGASKAKIGVFEKTGRMLKHWEIAVDTRNDGAGILDNLSLAIDSILEQEALPKSEIEGIGVGVPGPVRRDGVVNKCVNLGWGEKHVEKEFAALCGLPVRAANDANVAALGEMWQGSAKGCRDVVMVALRTGVGGGMIIDGKLVYGFGGAAGEIGHICVNEDEKVPCNCGKYGCLEQYASAAGIVKLAKRRMTESTESTHLREYGTLTAKHIYDEAKGGDKMALELVDEVGRVLGLALANVACVVNPAVFVIGGGVSNAGEILLNTVKKHYAENAFHACLNTNIVLARLGNDAGMYGSAKLIFGEGHASGEAGHDPDILAMDFTQVV